MVTSPLRVQDAISTVQHALELAETEAAIYVHLCLTGAAKVGDLASALKLHRNEVYRNASRLVSRGLVQMTLERPARYCAVSPRNVFDSAIANRLATVDELRVARDQVAPLLTEMQLHIGAPAKSTYKVVQGRTEIYGVRDRMLAEAESRIDWASTFPPVVALSELSGGLDVLRARVESGVAFRGIFRTTPAGWRRLAALAGLPGSQMRESEVERTIHFLLVDGDELLMWVVNDPSESLHAKDEVAIHTTAPGFVQAEAMFFDQTWARSTQAPAPAPEP